MLQPRLRRGRLRKRLLKRRGLPEPRNEQNEQRQQRQERQDHDAPRTRKKGEDGLVRQYRKEDAVRRPGPVRRRLVPGHPLDQSLDLAHALAAAPVAAPTAAPAHIPVLAPAHPFQSRREDKDDVRAQGRGRDLQYEAAVRSTAETTTTDQGHDRGRDRGPAHHTAVGQGHIRDQRRGRGRHEDAGTGYRKGQCNTRRNTCVDSGRHEFGGMLLSLGEAKSDARNLFLLLATPLTSHISSTLESFPLRPLILLSGWSELGFVLHPPCSHHLSLFTPKSSNKRPALVPFSSPLHHIHLSTLNDIPYHRSKPH